MRAAAFADATIRYSSLDDHAAAYTASTMTIYTRSEERSRWPWLRRAPRGFRRDFARLRFFFADALLFDDEEGSSTTRSTSGRALSRSSTMRYPPRVVRVAAALLIGLTTGVFVACTAFSSADSPEDAGLSADATSDGIAATDASDSGCPGYPQAIFCDSFDDGPLGAHWTNPFKDDGTLTLSDALSTSPPSSLAVDIAPSETDSAGAELTFDLPSAPQRLRSSFDVYFETLDNRSAVIGTISRRDGIHSYDVGLVAGAGGMRIVEGDDLLLDGGSFTAPHAFQRIALKTWTRVIIEVDYGGSGAAPTLTLTLQQRPGIPATPALDHVPITPTLVGRSTRFSAGVEYIAAGRTAEVRMYIDNVVLETP
jgi:hypothetical protein